MPSFIIIGLVVFYCGWCKVGDVNFFVIMEACQVAAGHRPDHPTTKQSSVSQTSRLHKQEINEATPQHSRDSLDNQLYIFRHKIKGISLNAITPYCCFLSWQNIFNTDMTAVRLLLGWIHCRVSPFWCKFQWKYRVYSLPNNIPLMLMKGITCFCCYKATQCGVEDLMKHILTL